MKRTTWLLVAGLLPVVAQADAPAYSVDPAGSSLGFTASQTGAEFDGSFRKFTAQIRFSPRDLAGSRFDVVVDTTSIDTQDDDRDTALRGPDLFHVEKYPRARFVTTAFTPRGGDSFEARGKLTIRDVTREVRVPFTFASVREGGRESVSLEGTAELNRLDFGVGQGEWQDTSWVANEVIVRFALRLLPAAGAPAAERAPAEERK